MLQPPNTPSNTFRLWLRSSLSAEFILPEGNLRNLERLRSSNSLEAKVIIILLSHIYKMRIGKGSNNSSLDIMMNSTMISNLGFNSNGSPSRLSSNLKSIDKIP